MDHLKRVPGPSTNPVGRPSASKPPAPELPAEPYVAEDGAGVAVRCPHCGRHAMLRTTGTRASGERECVCRLCGKGFVYRAAIVRAK